MKKIIIGLFSIILAISLAACGSSPAAPPASPTAATAAGPAAATEPAAPQQSQVVTITDQAGRTVEVGDVETISVCWYMANDFVLAMGLGDKLASIGPHDDFQIMVLPGIPNLQTVGRGRPDMEKLAALNPDLFIHTVADKENIDAIERLGIPMIQIDPEDIDATLEAYHLVGKATGNEGRAIMLEEYYRNTVKIAADRIGNVPEDQRPTFVLLGGEKGKVADGSMMQSEMIVNGGGVNKAASIAAEEFWPEVGVEKVFEWNPDVIFVSRQAKYTAEEILQDPVWADLAAVKNGRVYELPSKLHNWENPGMATCLGTVWSMMKLYPEQYSEEEMDKLVSDFYKTVYNLDIGRSALDK